MRIRTHVLLSVFGAGCTASALAQSDQFRNLKFMPAPFGDPEIVAGQIIHDNFDKQICPQVALATRQEDGSIMAVCDNKEVFMVLIVKKITDGEEIEIAMRCSRLPGGCFKPD